MFGDNLKADLDSPRTLEVSRVVSLQNTRDKCGRNPKNAKHDSETILNDSPERRGLELESESATDLERESCQSIH